MKKKLTIETDYLPGDKAYGLECNCGRWSVFNKNKPLTADSVTVLFINGNTHVDYTFRYEGSVYPVMWFRKDIFASLKEAKAECKKRNVWIGIALKKGASIKRRVN